MNGAANTWEKPKTYAVRHRDEGIRAASRSGGIFTALSDRVLQENGVVYGCVLIDDFRAVHIRAEDAETRNRMRGSKYIQSSLGDTFHQVARDLQDGRRVLFSGTSCQVAGLKGFLGKEYANLLCVDVVCHGVPSPAVWQAYLKWQERRNSGRVVAADFRNKANFGWRDHVESLWLEDGRRVDSKVFTTIFYGHSVLRPCCYECPFKKPIHPGEITIADYWRIEKAAPEFDDNKGVSLVLINNEAGETAFEQVKDTLVWKPTRLEDSMQTPLYKPFARPANRDRFWEDFASRPFDRVAAVYGGLGLRAKCRRILRGMKRRVKKLMSKR